MFQKSSPLFANQFKQKKVPIINFLKFPMDKSLLSQIQKGKKLKHTGVHTHHLSLNNASRQSPARFAFAFLSWTVHITAFHATHFFWLCFTVQLCTETNDRSAPAIGMRPLSSECRLTIGLMSRWGKERRCYWRWRRWRERRRVRWSQRWRDADGVWRRAFSRRRADASLEAQQRWCWAHGSNNPGSLQ